jgi:hypothetical protein
MSGINARRILIGGLVAGAIIVAFEAASQMLLGAAWAAQFGRLGLASPGETAMFTMLPGMFAVGVLAMWLYALATARLGAKLETACIVGLIVWALACFIPNLMMASLGILSPRLFWMSSLVAVVQMPVAVCIGSRLYKDAGVAAAPPVGARAA